MDYYENYAKPWTEEDSDFIRENYPKLGKEKCAKALGRTEYSVKAQAKKLRVFARVVEPWSKEDTKKLIELYPTTDTEKLAEILGTTKERIWSKVAQFGITKAPEYVKKCKKKCNAWTDEEVAILKRMYADHYTEDIGSPSKRGAKNKKGITYRNMLCLWETHFRPKKEHSHANHSIRPAGLTASETSVKIPAGL